MLDCLSDGFGSLVIGFELGFNPIQFGRTNSIIEKIGKSVETLRFTWFSS